MGPEDPGAWDPCATCNHGRWRHHHGVCTEYADCACAGRFVEPLVLFDRPVVNRG
jgi:hypothetical protein